MSDDTFFNLCTGLMFGLIAGVIMGVCFMLPNSPPDLPAEFYINRAYNEHTMRLDCKTAIAVQRTRNPSYTVPDVCYKYLSPADYLR